MLRAFVIFCLALLLSLIFHLVLGRNSSINIQNISIKISLADLLLAGLLLSNLLAFIYIIRRK